MSILCIIPLGLLKEKTTGHFTLCSENLMGQLFQHPLQKCKSKTMLLLFSPNHSYKLYFIYLQYISLKFIHKTHALYQTFSGVTDGGGVANVSLAAQMWAPF